MPEIISTDRGTEFMAADFQAMIRDNNIHHRTSSAYNPHSNNRAETVKRLLTPDAIKNNLDNPDFIRAIIMHRNTPIERGLPSPNELLFGRNVPDYLPARGDAHSEKLHSDEANTFETRLRALEEIREIRQEECRERWSEHSKQLKPLENGAGVAVQNGSGSQPKRWDQKGRVVMYNDHDSYDIQLDGSRRVKTQNRGHLRQLNHQVLNRPSTQPPTGGSEQQPAGETCDQSRPTTTRHPAAATPEQPAAAAPEHVRRPESTVG